MDPDGHELEQLRRQALFAARGLSSGDAALAGVLRDLEQERSRTARAFHGGVLALAEALAERDGHPAGHAERVRGLAVAVAQRLGLEPAEEAEVELAALLHGVGAAGAAVLRGMPGLGAVATAVRHGSERWDGQGGPDRLRGEAIPRASRIVRACTTAAGLDRDAAGDELRAAAGEELDPAVVATLIDHLEQHGDDADPGGATTPPVPSAPADDAPRLELELHALIATASAVGAAQRLEDVVETAAEQALQALGAASFSVSRWETERRILRTLINAGELGPDEVRRPVEEVYLLEEDGGELRALIEGGRTYISSLGDEDVHPLVRALLERSGRHHAIAVGVMFAGLPWGALWATRHEDAPPFDGRDARFLRTVAGMIAAAVGRAEVFSRMAELAFEDPLTGVANRRALDERLEHAVDAALAAGTDIALLLCDVDDLKELNDTRGHQEGDRALVGVAEALRAETADEPGAMVARIGGDEFAVLLEGLGAEHAHALGARLLERLGGREAGPLTVSCGVASLGLGARRPGDLLRSADAAQYTAKRAGRARVSVADPDADATWRARSGERRAIRGQPAGATPDVGPLLRRVLAELDGPFGARPPLDRLEAACLALAEAVDATALAISRRDPGSPRIVTGFTIDRRTQRSSGRRFWNEDESYAFDEFPATAEVMTRGGSFIVRDDDAEADPAERALLKDFGMSGVLVVGVPDAVAGGGGWLVELYADALTAPLDDVQAPLRLVAGEAVRGSG